MSIFQFEKKNGLSRFKRFIIISILIYLFIYLFFLSGICSQVNRGFGDMYSLAWQQGDTEQQLVEDLAIPHPPSPSVFTLTDRESQAMLQIESQPPEYESLFGVASQPVPDMATTPTLDMVTSPTDNLTPISPGYNVPYEPESEFNQQIRPYIQQVVQESLQQAILNRQARLNHRAMLNQQVMMMNQCYT